MTWYSAYQPVLFPPVYLIERIARVQHWVILEEAQFDRSCVQVMLMGPSGQAMFSPTLSKPSNRQTFADIAMLEPDRWATRFARSVQHNYGKQDGFKELSPSFDDLMDRLGRLTWLTEVCRVSLEWILDVLKMDTALRTSAELVRPRPADATSWMAAFAEPLGATDYLQGATAMRSYFRRGPFERAGVHTWGQDFRCSYSTLHARLADASISILDALFVWGPDLTRDLLQVRKGKGDVGTAYEITRGGEGDGQGPGVGAAR